MENLWSKSLDIYTAPKPLQVFHQQAGYLGARTGNIVRARFKYLGHDDSNRDNNGNLIYGFYIFSDCLNGYSTLAFTVECPLFGYPATIKGINVTTVNGEDKKSPKWAIDHEGEVEKVVTDILASNHVLRIVGIILAHVNSGSKDNLSTS